MEIKPAEEVETFLPEKSNPHEGIPHNYIDMIGTIVEMRGPIFSYKKILPHTLIKIYDVRFGMAAIMVDNVMKHPTIEFLAASSSMKKKQWTKPFPCREIELKEDEI